MGTLQDGGFGSFAPVESLSLLWMRGTAFDAFMARQEIFYLKLLRTLETVERMDSSTAKVLRQPDFLS